MMFSTKAEYGVRVMAHLAREGGGTPPPRRRSRSARSPTPRACRWRTSSTSCSACAAPELVESRRGAHGGYSLARPPAEISMAEVVEALEGEIAPIECITADADGALVCSREGESPCPTKLLWTRVQGSIVRTLNDMTLDDLVRPFSKEPKEKLTV